MGKYLIQPGPSAPDTVRSIKKRADYMPRSTGHLELQLRKPLKDHTDP